MCGVAAVWVSAGRGGGTAGYMKERHVTQNGHNLIIENVVNI